MLVDAMVVPTVAVTDLDRAKRFFSEQVGLKLLGGTGGGDFPTCGYLSVQSFA